MNNRSKTVTVYKQISAHDLVYCNLNSMNNSSRSSNQNSQVYCSN